MIHDICPNGEAGCQPKDNKMYAIVTCAFHKGVEICLGCSEFPLRLQKAGLSVMVTVSSYPEENRLGSYCQNPATSN